jgi:hypothetical protein
MPVLSVSSSTMFLLLNLRRVLLHLFLMSRLCWCVCWYKGKIVLWNALYKLEIKAHIEEIMKSNMFRQLFLWYKHFWQCQRRCLVIGTKLLSKPIWGSLLTLNYVFRDGYEMPDEALMFVFCSWCWIWVIKLTLINSNHGVTPGSVHWGPPMFC